MDFMKIIQSLEQLLYELMVWLVFYPLTLFKATFHPLRLMDYADDELGDADADRYSDTLSPPIFLAITLGLVHFVEMAGGWNLETDGLLADDTNLIAFRLVAFALFPLMLSLRLLRRKRIALDRKSLRLPFYSQCFVAAPFALGIDVATVLSAGGADVGVALGVAGASILWYLGVQTMWFRQNLSQGWVWALGNALRGFLEATFICFLMAMAVEVMR
ncbi:hypothetical protein [Aurantiacibacter luteus]|uniref:Permease n=1 Tax=Aurantiacibacter luteus TaxID=1581420 RepID=A0A0G9MSV8_9SPHN|nr:hypothetical protein [Aurantiacibacter luteus]KLE33847.1 hypothetical protein AAW00_12300 [Aurantiacibacter luteus]